MTCCRARVSITVALLLVHPLAAIVAGQGATDFSGVWTMAPTARAAGAARGAAPPSLSDPGDFGSGWGQDITLVQNASTLTVTWTPFHPREMQPPLAFVYRLDGAASTTAINMGRGPQEQQSTAAWRGASLAITTTHRFRDEVSGQTIDAETTQVLSRESPTTLVIETTRAGVLGGRSSTTRSVYQRR
jgi:hypothetical protein